MFFEKPDGYSEAAIEQLAESISYEAQPVSDVTPENLIVIMNESLSDMRVISDYETNQEYFPFIKAIKVLQYT